jgi:hypothetical protein
MMIKYSLIHFVSFALQRFMVLWSGKGDNDGKGKDGSGSKSNENDDGRQW